MSTAGPRTKCHHTQRATQTCLSLPGGGGVCACVWRGGKRGRGEDWWWVGGGGGGGGALGVGVVVGVGGVSGGGGVVWCVGWV